LRQAIEATLAINSGSHLGGPHTKPVRGFVPWRTTTSAEPCGRGDSEPAGTTE
jgi:hypothetical protein